MTDEQLATHKRRALVAEDCRELLYSDAAVTLALIARLEAAESTCQAAESIVSEDSVRDEMLNCYVMGVELIERLAAWRRARGVEP